MSNRSGVSQPTSKTARVTSALQERISLYSVLSSQQHLVTIGKCLSDIDFELREIDTVLATFRRQRNALVPVARFPPEILSLVFHALAELEPHHTQDPLEYPDILAGEVEPNMGWIKVTQVCHAWREAALVDSQLWTAATTLFGKDWFERTLLLGKSQPKQLDLWVEDELPNTYIQLVGNPGPLDKLARLRVLGDESDLSNLMGLHAPALESLHVHVHFRGGRHVFPSTLFGGVTSHLRDLYVHNMGVSLSAPFISSLTHLSLSMRHGANTVLVSFRDLVDTLSSLVTLESLTMQGYAFEVLDEDIPMMDGMDIICSQLVDVNVCSSGWFSVFLLMARLRPAPSARMTFATRYPILQAPEGALILDAFRRRFLDADRSPIYNMQTVEWSARAPHSWRESPTCHGPGAPYYETSLILSTWHDAHSDYLLCDYQGYCEHPPRPDFQLILETSPSLAAQARRLDELIPFAAFPAARCLSVRPVYRMTFEVSFDNGWEELFRVAQTLEWLRVDRDVAEDLISGVHFDKYNDRPNTVPETLRTLALLGVRWDYDWQEMSDFSVSYMLNDIGDATAINEIIVGAATHEDETFSVGWNGATLSAVKRHDWFIRGHEDWDELADS